jgi:hypothetical protein
MENGLTTKLNSSENLPDWTIFICAYWNDRLNYSALSVSVILYKTVYLIRARKLRSLGTNKHQVLHRIQSVWTFTNLQYTNFMSNKCNLKFFLKKIICLFSADCRVGGLSFGRLSCRRIVIRWIVIRRIVAGVLMIRRIVVRRIVGIRIFRQSLWVRARSQLATRYVGRLQKSSYQAGNELVPRLTKNTSSGLIMNYVLLKFSTSDLSTAPDFAATSAIRSAHKPSQCLSMAKESVRR